MKVRGRGYVGAGLMIREGGVARRCWGEWREGRQVGEGGGYL